MKEYCWKKQCRSVSYLHRKWIKHDVDVNKSTKLRRFEKIAFQSRVPKIQLFITIKQKNEREWIGAKEGFSWDMDDWKKILFSDETAFWSFFVCVGIKMFGYDEWNKNGTYENGGMKWSASVMVRDCMTAHSPGRLCIVNERINFEI